MRKELLVLALLGWAETPAIEAQPESAYYGVSIGELDYSDRAAGLGGKFHDSTSSWRLMIGVQLTDHFALEGGYGETSSIRATAPGSQPQTELAFETQLRKLFTVRGLGTLPLDNGLSLMAGLGFFTFEQDLALTINGAPFLSADVDPEGFGNFAYYLGAQYDWDRVALRLSYEKWDFGSEARVIFVGNDAEEVALSLFYKL